MIAAWMLFTLEVSALLFVSAWLAERALNAAKRPARWVWMTAIIATALIPLTALFAPVPRLAIPELQAVRNADRNDIQATPMKPGSRHVIANSSAATPLGAAPNVIPQSVNRSDVASAQRVNNASSEIAGAATDQSHDSIRKSMALSLTPSDSLINSTARKSVGLPVLPASVAAQLEVTPNSAFQRLDNPLRMLWVAFAAVGFLVCLFAIARTTRQRGTWSGEYVDGTPVLVTHDVGPALIGVLQYSIVVPRWVFELEGTARRLILAHEREHARRYDPVLLALGVILLVVAPWNVVNWFMLRRLRLAIEMDCDQRVLRAHPDTRSYSSLLLDVAERTLPSVMPQAALVEYGTSLETRIRAMISPSAQHRVLRVGGNLLAMGALVAVACVTPRPYASLPPSERVARLRSDLADAEKALTNDVGAVVGNTQQPNQSDAPDKSRYERNHGIESPRTLDSYYGKLSKQELIRDDSIRKAKLTESLSLPAGILAARDADAAMLRVASVIYAVAPQTLGQWPRGDSTVFLMLKYDGSIARVFSQPKSRFSRTKSSLDFLTTIFFPDALSEVDSSQLVSITHDQRGRLYDVPLQVVVARLMPSAQVPRTSFEIIPKNVEMIATLHKTRPEVFTDSSSSPLIGTLLYSTQGELLATNAVHSSEPSKWPDGQNNREFEASVFRAAFGDLMNGGPIFQSGAQTYLDDKTPHGGEWRMMYAVILKNGEKNTGGGMPIKSGKLSMNIASVMSYRAPQGVLDQKVIDAQLRNVVTSRLPQAFGKWDRSDSALYLVFDHDDQLYASTSGPIAQNGQLAYVIGLLKSRMPLPPSGSFEVVGFSTFARSNSGYILDKPLQIVWGRVKEGTQLSNYNSAPNGGVNASRMMASGSSSRSTDAHAIDREMHMRTLSIIKSRAPQTIIDADRKNSAVALILDSDDQYLSTAVGPIADNGRLLYLLDYFGNLSAGSVNIDDIVTVGVENYSNDSSLHFNNPVQIVWARLKPGAKLKK